jgi:hypothetical protein
MSQDKPLPITKVMVWKAYQQVKRNGKAAGVDGQSLDDFAKDLENNLYKLWNRMASGSYFPPAVRRVEIPKSNGGVRPLGIPTVADRIAQMVVKQVLEPQLEPIFDQDSYGYRPVKAGVPSSGVTSPAPPPRLRRGGPRTSGGWPNGWACKGWAGPFPWFENHLNQTNHAQSPYCLS